MPIAIVFYFENAVEGDVKPKCYLRDKDDPFLWLYFNLAFKKAPVNREPEH